MTLRDLSSFDKIKTESIAFDKCELKPNVLNTLSDDVKKLQLISCDTSGLNISKLKNIEELHLIYTIEDEELISLTSGLNLKKLAISGDLLSNKENRNYINALKKKGVKIEITGPTI